MAFCNPPDVRRRGLSYGYVKTRLWLRCTAPQGLFRDDFAEKQVDEVGR